MVDSVQERYRFTIPRLSIVGNGDRWKHGGPFPSASVYGVLHLAVHQLQLQATGLLRVLCEVTKLCSAEQVQTCKEQLLQVVSALEGNQSLMGNTVIRQLRTKLIARIAIRSLPGKTRRFRAKGACNAAQSPQHV